MVGTMLNFPACKTRQSLHALHRRRGRSIGEEAASLPYLAVDHYVKADAEHFKQRAVAFAVLILVIPGKSAGGHSC